MSAEYITVTPASEDGDEKPAKRIMCHAIISYFTTEESENVIVLMDGVPVTILEDPEFIDAQLNEYRRRP